MFIGKHVSGNVGTEGLNQAEICQSHIFHHTLRDVFCYVLDTVSNVTCTCSCHEIRREFSNGSACTLKWTMLQNCKLQGMYYAMKTVQSTSQ